jgi:hypothetical protein
MERIGEGFIFRLEVPFITSKALLARIFCEVEGPTLHKHPENALHKHPIYTVKKSLLFIVFLFFLSGHNMGTTLILMLQLFNVFFWIGQLTIGTP